MNKTAKIKRNAFILTLDRAGVSKTVLADQFDLSWVQIYRIIKTEEAKEQS